MKDMNGRAYALVSDIKEQDIVETDGDFTCIKPYENRIVVRDNDGLYINCGDGHHYLAGQIEGEEPNQYYIGLYKVN